MSDQAQTCYGCRWWGGIGAKGEAPEYGVCGIGAHLVESSDDTSITLPGDTCEAWEPAPAARKYLHITMEIPAP